jgi:thymidine phosphorylase
MVAVLGGPPDLLERPNNYLPEAPVSVAVFANRRGIVSGVNVRRVGLAIVDLGGGRTDPGRAIDHAVGLTGIASIGAEVGPDRPLCVVRARDHASADLAAAEVRSAIAVSDAAPSARPAVLERVGVGD